MKKLNKILFDIIKSQTPRWATHKRKNNYITQVLPQE